MAPGLSSAIRDIRQLRMLDRIKKANLHVISASWDDWVPQDRVRKFTDENKELAANLHQQMKQLQGKGTSSKSTAKKGGRANGSDFSSARGSEERHTSMAAQSGRGPRRNRDYDLEHVSTIFYAGKPSILPGAAAYRECHSLQSEVWKLHWSSDLIFLMNVTINSPHITLSCSRLLLRTSSLSTPNAKTPWDLGKRVTLPLTPLW